MSDIDLLKYYAVQWERYTTGAGYINKLFAYLNKHWVKREKDEGRKEVYTVYTVSVETVENWWYAGARPHCGEVVDTG